MDVETATNVHRALEEAALLMVVFSVLLSYVIVMTRHCCYHLEFIKNKIPFHFNAGSDGLRDCYKRSSRIRGGSTTDGCFFSSGVSCHSDDQTLLLSFTIYKKLKYLFISRQALMDVETATKVHGALEEAALLMVVFSVPLSHVILMTRYCCYCLQFIKN
jgi:hypothetical protein